jgi:hypothetical protein
MFLWGAEQVYQRPVLHTSHSGYCSATCMAHAPEPDPHSKIRRGREIGGNISLLSNIMLKISCIYWRRSISSCSPRPVVRSAIRRRTKSRLRRRLEQSISRFRGRIAGTPYCRGQQPPDTCCRRGRFGNRCVRLSGALCIGVGLGSSADYAPFVHGCSIGSLAAQFLRVANLKEGSKTHTQRERKRLEIQSPGARVGRPGTRVQAS